MPKSLNSFSLEINFWTVNCIISILWNYKFNIIHFYTSLFVDEVKFTVNWSSLISKKKIPNIDMWALYFKAFYSYDFSTNTAETIFYTVYFGRCKFTLCFSSFPSFLFSIFLFLHFQRDFQPPEPLLDPPLHIKNNIDWI